LGSGKTTCVKGICAGLGVEEEVTSPTFTLINEYQGRLPVFHFDFYRIGSAQELRDLGLDEYFYGEGVCLIEWPEIVSAMLPKHHFEIHFFGQFQPEWEHRREITVIQTRPSSD